MTNQTQIKKIMIVMWMMDQGKFITPIEMYVIRGRTSDKSLKVHKLKHHKVEKQFRITTDVEIKCNIFVI